MHGMSLFLFIMYALIVISGIASTVFWFWRKSVMRKGEISRSLGLALYMVLLPKINPAEAENISAVDKVRERIAIMEQLYRIFRDVHDSGWHEFLYGPPSFSLELTIPEVGEEILFYVAVPRRFGLAVEKAIQGLYPNARIDRSKDYNIFNPIGKHFGIFLSGARNQYLPLHTYKSLEADSLKLFIEGFSKIAERGEGAVIQIVAKPAGKNWSRHLQKIAEFLKNGTSLDGAILKASKSGVQKLIDEFSKGANKKKSEDGVSKKPTPQNESLIRAIEEKASKPLFEASVRVVASADTKERAEEIGRALAAPFHAFAYDALNGLKLVEPKEGGGISDFIYRFSFRLLQKKNRLILSSEELASIFHFPNTPQESHKLKVAKSREAPSPIEMPSDGIFLGWNIFRGDERKVVMTDDDRRRHLYVIGQTGTGKTAFMREMIRQDIEAGHGVCFIDPHGDTVEDIIGLIPPNRADDLIYFNPSDISRPMGLNMLEYDLRYPEQKTFIVNELMDIFNKLYNMSVAGGPMFEQYFRNATQLVMDDPASGSTLLDVVRVLADKNFRDLKLSKTKNPLIKEFWTKIAEKTGGDASLQNMVPYITSKFDTFLSNDIMRPIVAQEKSAFNFREVMDQKKILLINLSKGRLGELNSSLIGLIMVGKLLMAALSRVDILDQEARKDFYLYIDEFQNVTTKSIATILSEARKYRLNLIIAHQFIGQLEEDIKKAVFGNVGSFVSFRVGIEDTEMLVKQFSPVVTTDDLTNLPNRYGYARLLIKGQVARPFSFKTADLQRGNPDIARKLKEYSGMKYGKPREEVEEDIMRRYRGETEKPE
ncbi:MAG: type IV secretion system DNA-binding domain-containing protein [Patescibacteria group bacterium]